MKKWFFLLALAAALAGYWAPWVHHKASALVLTGLDMGEFVKFLPQFRSGELRFLREVFYLPLLLSSLSFILMASSPALSYPRWARGLLLMLAWAMALSMLPPAWSPPILLKSEFIRQTIAIVFCLTLPLAWPILKRIPSSALYSFLLLASLLGSILPSVYFEKTRPFIVMLYTQPIGWGWGIYLMLAGFAFLAGLSLSELVRRKGQKVTDGGSPEALVQPGSIARAAGILAAGNIASRVMGLGRETIIAHYFGATGEVSAFRVASIIPTMVYELLIGGMLSAALVPVLSEYASSERKEELGRVVGIVLGVFGLGLGVVVLMIELFAPLVAWLLGGGFSVELRRITTNLIRIIIPALLIFGSSGILTGLLYSLKRFSAPAFGAAVYNLGIILAAPLFSRFLDIYSLALGIVMGALLQFLILIPSLRDIPIKLSFNLRHPALKRIFMLYLPIAAGLIISEIQVAIDRNLASRTGPSSIAWMANATTLIQFPHGLISIAISTAILPTLARIALSREKNEEFLATLASGIKMVLAAAIPATVGLFILSYPIIATIFEHGRFTPYDTQYTVLALRLYLIGLVFASVDWPLNYAFYARKDTFTPAAVGVLSVLVYLGVALTLMKPMGMAGLVLADSAKHLSHCITMLLMLHRKVGSLKGYGISSTILKGALASLAMAFAVGEVLQVIPMGSFQGKLTAVIAGGFVGAGIYLAMAMIMRMEEILLIKEAVLSRLRRI
ncbi:MAG: murein biosynthesis integral membrane protein MurJ [Anaerolineae bacterium]|nr:murein biosynthesis integral membrane protein MurJ [Anaerolineae bacterium]MDW8101639.1 murein biosynthesis integral membrane protein MurJ [Anaerolineae bacterium]